MPRWPRSTSRVRPPVWRARWKRSDSACRWRNTLQRDLAHRALRHLGEQELAQLGEQRRRQRAGGRTRRAARTAPRAARRRGRGCRRSPSAAAARRRSRPWRATRQASAASTRPLYSHRYGSSVRDRRPVAATRARERWVCRQRQRGAVVTHAQSTEGVRASTEPALHVIGVIAGASRRPSALADGDSARHAWQPQPSAPSMRCEPRRACARPRHHSLPP